MSSALVSQTLQGAVLSATSNILAQAIDAYKNDKPLTLDISPILQFALFSILSNPPNILWQSFLEDVFPTEVALPPPPPSSKKPSPTAKKTQRSTTNLVIKFLLDQTVGALFNNLMFLVFMGYTAHAGGGGVAGEKKAWDTIAATVRENLVPMAIDGYKFWPAVSLVGFLWVPVHRRVVFGCAAGVLWGIYLSLMVKA